MDAKEIVKKIKQLEIITRRRVDEVFAGNYKSSFRGQGLEVNDLRKYEEGDDVRHIDWMVTARKSKLYVKKFQETRELTTIILVDISASMKFGTSNRSKDKVVLETAAFILFSAMKAGDKFGAIIFADKVYKYLPPKKGRANFILILRELIYGFDNNFEVVSDLKVAFDFLNKIIKKKSIIFLLTDEINSLSEKDSTQRSMKIANKKHDLVYLKIFDPFEKKIDNSYPSILMKDLKSNDLDVFDFQNKNFVQTYNKLRNKRREVEKKLVNKNKIDILEISTKDNIYKELLLFFRKRSLKQ